MQSMSEHLQDKHLLPYLLLHNKQEISYINVDNMPDSLLAGNLALRAQQIFMPMAMCIKRPALTAHLHKVTGI